MQRPPMLAHYSTQRPSGRHLYANVDRPDQRQVLLARDEYPQEEEDLLSWSVLASHD